MYLPPRKFKFPTQREALNFFAEYTGALVRNRDRENVSGWVVTNGRVGGGREMFRCWGNEGGGSAWTEKREEATRYARRCDAEEVHAEDEDAWRIVPYDKGMRAAPDPGTVSVQPDKVVIGNAHGGAATYECHITTHVGQALAAESLAKSLSGWKTSEIKRDPVLGDGSHFYLTAHDTDYSRMVTRMSDMANALTEYGVPVLRQKIEAIVYDTRHKV